MMIDFTPLLADSENYRDFLTKAFQLIKEKEGRFSYAELSRRAGFSARSYPRAVVLGEKRISARSLPKFIKALGLRGDARVYFNLLVMKEESDLNHDKLSSTEIERKISRIKNRIHQRSLGKDNSELQVLFKYQNWLPVYSALGTPETGASLEDVVSRTRLSQEVCFRVLESMQTHQVVKKRDSRYYVQSPVMIFSGLGKNEFFRQTYHRALQSIQQNAETDFSLNDRLFFNSVFSVQEKKLPQLKKELRDVLLRFVDATEDAEGDRVAQLTVGFLPT